MRKCPKCGLSSEESKICRKCGAILEVVDETDVAESSRIAPNATTEEENRASAAAGESDDADSGKPAIEQQRAWTCLQCKERVPAGFMICWNCGADPAGVPDAEFSEPKTGIKKTQTRLPVPHRVCPKCGSTRIIPRVRICDQGQYSGGILQVVVYGDPGAILFKDRLFGNLAADICGDCGHAELKVDDPGELYEHYLRSR